MRGSILNNNTIIILASLYVLVSCQKQMEPQNDKYSVTDKVFYAETPDYVTKTYLAEDHQLYWTAGDRLSVFRSTVNERYKFDGVTGELKNSFSKDDSSIPGVLFSTNYAIFPYKETTSTDIEGKYRITLPANQTYCNNSFGIADNTMFAVTENIESDLFKFKNVCGYLLLKLSGGDVVRRIRLYGNNNERIAGDAELNITATGEFNLEMSESATKMISLDCGESGVQLSEDTITYFWIVVPPVSFNTGFTVEIENDHGRVETKRTNKSIGFSSNSAKQMANVQVSLSSGNSIESFSLTDGVNSFPAFDISNDIISVQVPNDLDLKNLTAVFSYFGVKVCVNGATVESGVGTQDFSDFTSPLQYVVYSESGESKTYTIRVFNLPIVTLVTPSPIKSKTVWTDNCSVTIRESNGVLTDYGMTVQVRGRGNSTWGASKKPYTFKLNKKATVLGMPADKRWNLLANAFDRTNIRNDVTLEIARRSDGMGWAPRGQFVELILNGEFVGTYYLCEHVKIAKDRINITEMSVDDITETTITGGYLLEYEKFAKEDPYFETAKCEFPVYVKSPDYDDGCQAQWDWISSYIGEVESLLTDANAVKSHAYLDYLDIDSFIDYWFTYEICGNGTELANVHSIYMHKDRGGKLKAGPAWDFDLFTYRPQNTGLLAKNKLYYKYLFNDPYFVAKVKERWPSFKDGLNDMPAYIQSRIDMLAYAAARNAEMWPFSKTSSNQDELMPVPEACALLKSCYEARIVELDGLIKNLSVTYDNKGTGTEDFGNQDDQTGGFDFGF